MSQKIQGKFYPLKSEEWLDSINKLTHSELKILYYVRSLDPYNNGINLTPAQIAKDMSTDKVKMHRSTVGRALKSLDKQGFINMELLRVRIKVNPKGFLAEEETTESKNVVATQQCCDHATQSAATQHRVQPRNTECSHATQSAATQQPEAKTQSEQEVQDPKTIQTYSDFIQTLSEGERENFLNFVREEIKNLPKPVNDLEAWLANPNQAGINRWEVYYNNFLAGQPHLKLGASMPPGSTKSEIQELAAQCRARWAKEISQQQIAAEQAFLEKAAAAQSSEELAASEPVKEKLAQLLSPDPESPKKKPNATEDIKQWRIEIEQREQRRIEALLKKIKGGSQP